MPNVGPLEIAIVAVIALIVFGPKRLPELGNSLGKGIREFKSSLDGSAGDDDDAGKPEGVAEKSASPDDPERA